MVEVPLFIVLHSVGMRCGVWNSMHVVLCVGVDVVCVVLFCAVLCCCAEC